MHTDTMQAHDVHVERWKRWSARIPENFANTSGDSVLPVLTSAAKVMNYFEAHWTLKWEERRVLRQRKRKLFAFFLAAHTMCDTIQTMGFVRWESTIDLEWTECENSGRVWDGNACCLFAFGRFVSCSDPLSYVGLADSCWISSVRIKGRPFLSGQNRALWDVGMNENFERALSNNGTNNNSFSCTQEKMYSMRASPDMFCREPDSGSTILTGDETNTTTEDWTLNPIHSVLQGDLKWKYEKKPLELDWDQIIAPVTDLRMKWNRDWNTFVYMDSRCAHGYCLKRWYVDREMKNTLVILAASAWTGYKPEVWRSLLHSMRPPEHEPPKKFLINSRATLWHISERIGNQTTHQEKWNGVD